jgi:hypothetical protein
MKLERRRVRRRSLPFVRSGVLEVNGRSHIVAVLDLSADSAFVKTRISVKAQDRVALRMVLPRDGREVVLPCQIIRRLEASKGQPAGLALRFRGLDASAIRRIEVFAAEGLLPHHRPVAQEHFEYKIADHEVDQDELNRLGLDGWRLAAVCPGDSGSRLVLMRRL